MKTRIFQTAIAMPHTRQAAAKSGRVATVPCDCRNQAKYPRRSRTPHRCADLGPSLGEGILVMAEMPPPLSDGPVTEKTFQVRHPSRCHQNDENGAKPQQDGCLRGIKGV